MWLLGGEQVYLDIRGLSDEIFRTRLSDTFDDCMLYLRLDPRREPIPVAPGVHYFMGGIKVDERHRTALPGLYAAGECACQYHGANRLGGNSLLGAIYGGITAAKTAVEDELPIAEGELPPVDLHEDSAADILAAQSVVRRAMAVARDRTGLEAGLSAIEKLPGDIPLLGRAVLISALARSESRGSHYRTDFPEQNDAEFRKTTVARFEGGDITVQFEDVQEGR
jgi:succinate dehydrogenase / fumarate reductase flavoprotein subunit